MLELNDKEGHAKFLELLSKADVFVSNRRKGWRERFHITPEETIKQASGSNRCTDDLGRAKPDRGRIA